jgi:hypothetical protein
VGRRDGRTRESVALVSASIRRRLQIDDGEDGRIVVLRCPDGDDHAFEVNAGEMNKERLIWLSSDDAKALRDFLIEEIPS